MSSLQNNLNNLLTFYESLLTVIMAFCVIELVFDEKGHGVAFEDDDITHVEGSVDPIRDIEIIHEELQLKDEEMIGPIIDKLEKVAVRGGDKKLKPEYVSKNL